VALHTYRTQYGGGLAPGDRFRSPGVSLEHVWLVHSWTHPAPGLLDFVVLGQYIGAGAGRCPARCPAQPASLARS
jgi:hypothetical protein